jgi:hypothetical protein
LRGSMINCILPWNGTRDINPFVFAHDTDAQYQGCQRVDMATTMTAQPAMTEHIVQDSAYDCHCQIDSKPVLDHATTNISMSPELFEKLYLQPKLAHTSENVKKYANATPLGFMGYVFCSFISRLFDAYNRTDGRCRFVISTFTFSMVLMGWGGASGLPAVVFVPPFFYTIIPCKFQCTNFNK